MKIKLLPYLIFVTTIFFFSPLRMLAQDQEVQFPSDESGYLTTLENYLETVPDKKRKEILEAFSNWSRLYQPEENEWIELAEASNTLMSLGVSKVPQFSDFLSACSSFKKDDLGRQGFLKWLNYQRINLSKDPAFLMSAQTLWEFFQVYFTEQALYSSGAVEWIIQSEKAELKTDKGLYINFSQSKLTGIAGREKTELSINSCQFFPENNLLLVQGAKTTWKEVDLSENLVFADLGTFTLDLSKTVFSIDSVTFYDHRYFDYPLLGQYNNKIATGLPKERRSYPQFTTYETNTKIKNIYPEMDYRGGYSLQGRKLIGTNTGQNSGALTIYFQGDPRMRVSSDYFVFTPEKATGVNAAVSIYLEQDSVYHPGLSFSYRLNADEVSLIRDGRGLSNSRFFNTYHQIDLDVGMLTWIRSDANIKLSGVFGSLQNKAEFESSDFYSIDRFNQIQVADLVNPLILVKNCALHYNSRLYTTGDLAEFMDKPFYSVEEMLLNISFLGFVQYDTDKKLIEVNQRTFDFIDKHAERQDYDIIRFSSNQTPPSPNGYLNLSSNTLTVFGVESIEISEKREVTAYPAGQTVTVGKNRNIQFDGHLVSGLADFSGSGFRLNYDPFKLHLDTIELLKLQVHLPVNNSWENTKIVPISSVIENTSGTLYVDRTDNKSGILADSLPEYPMFVADTSAYVYYDQPQIQNGIYHRDTFYFQTEQLSIKGLANIHLKDSLLFPGRLITAGIFPEINVNLSYQTDQSLGFDTLFTPQEGYPVYGGKGTFYNQINMNTEGLLGKGILEYLGATMESEKFLFLPDEVRSLLTRIDITENIADRGSPKTSGEEVAVQWNPEANSMVANQKDGLLQLYQGAVFDGDVLVEPDGLKGNGVLSFPGYSIASENFQFYENAFEASHSHLTIQGTISDSADQQPSKNDFEIRQSRTFVDLNDSTIIVSPEDEQSEIFFPVNLYKASFSEVIWPIGTHTIKISEPHLVSTDIKQKELSFSGNNATFRKDLDQIDARGVEQIEIADVRIIPDAQRLIIKKDAFIETIPNATIFPQDTVFRHYISDAEVNLISADNYKASGHYVYLDRAQREFPVKMDHIGVNPQKITVAKGQVTADQLFYLSPEYAFQGEITLTMNKPQLRFSGYYQLQHDCQNFTPKWITLSDDVDPLSITIPVDSLTRDINQEKVYTGFYLSNQPIESYSTFLGPHTRYSDHPILEVKGQLHFNDETGEFVVASAQKTADPESILPEVRFDRQNCEVEAEGQFDLGIDLGQIALTAAGQAYHDLKTDSILLTPVIGLDFFMNQKSMDFMAKELNRYSDATAVNYSDQSFRRALQFYLGAVRANEILDELSLRGSFRRIPEEFKHSIQFSHLNLVWNPERGSFVSKGKIGISNIGDQPINKMFSGHLEITHRRGGGTMNLYIETDPGSYFYFYYSRGLMQVLAGPKFEKFNDLVRDTKEAKRKSESPGPAYQYYLGQYRLVRNFLNEISEQ